MGCWRKASYQNNIEEVISQHHSQKIDFPYRFVCSQSDTVAVCSKSRTKSYYLYIKKHYTSTNNKEEAGVLVNISCLTQRKQKHLLRSKQMLQFLQHCITLGKLLIQYLGWLFHNFIETRHFTDHVKDNWKIPSATCELYIGFFTNYAEFPLYAGRVLSDIVATQLTRCKLEFKRAESKVS